MEKDSKDSKKKDYKSKGGDSKTSTGGHIDTNELSESELENQRALLLQQLKYAAENDPQWINIIIHVI